MLKIKRSPNFSKSSQSSFYFKIMFSFGLFLKKICLFFFSKIAKTGLTGDNVCERVCLCVRQRCECHGLEKNWSNIQRIHVYSTHEADPALKIEKLFFHCSRRSLWRERECWCVEVVVLWRTWNSWFVKADGLTRPVKGLPRSRFHILN